MIALIEKATGREIGSLTESQLQFLIDQLEEESSSDQDYWVSRATIEMLRDKGADTELVETLSAALGDEDGLEVEWERL